MKKIKMKDTILSHYQKVHELEMDGYTVRVFKPRTMQQLPAHEMLSWIRSRAKDAIHYMIIEQKADWRLGNPDYGLWDAQTVYHYDPRGKAFNIYIAAILVRPFSREAYETYCRMHEAIEPGPDLCVFGDGTSHTQNIELIYRLLKKIKKIIVLIQKSDNRHRAYTLFVCKKMCCILYTGV